MAVNEPTDPHLAIETRGLTKVFGETRPVYWSAGLVLVFAPITMRLYNTER